MLDDPIYAGDTSPIWEVGIITSAPGETPITRADLDIEYECWIAVPGASPAIYREVTTKNDENDRFRAWLTPAETAQLGKGVHTVGIEIRNSTLTPPLIRETHVQVVIKTPAVPSA